MGFGDKKDRTSEVCWRSFKISQMVKWRGNLLPLWAKRELPYRIVMLECNVAFSSLSIQIRMGYAYAGTSTRIILPSVISLTHAFDPLCGSQSDENKIGDVMGAI